MIEVRPVAQKHAGRLAIMGSTLDPMRSIRTVTFCAVAFLLPAHAFGAAARSFLTLLRTYMQRGESDMQKQLNSGVIAASLAHQRDGEVAVMGAVRIPVTVDFYIDRFRHIVQFKKSPDVLSIAKFSEPPNSQTLASVSLEKGQTNALNGCRPGKCALKLSEDMMYRLSGAHDSDEVNTVFRTLLWEYIAKYIQEGTPAMIKYADKTQPINSSDIFVWILSRFQWLPDLAPELANAVNRRYRTDQRIEEFIYWSKEDFGLQPVVSVTHVLIFRAVIEGHAWAFIASKQIYADHYLNGSLGLTVLAADSEDKNAPQTSVAYFNCSVTDGLRGWVGAVQRSIVERRARTALEKHLLEIKRRLTDQYRQRARQP